MCRRPIFRRWKPDVGASHLPPFVDQICVWLGLIWDDAEELKQLAAVSHPKPTIDAGQTHEGAIKLANRLAQNIGHLDEQSCVRLKAELDRGDG